MPGSIAARTMAWNRRMGGSAGPMAASGESGNSNPVQVEMYINGSWVDITPYVMVRDDSGNIDISRGRSDEASNTDQSTCQFQLNNRDGRWSPRYTGGAYYGKIGRNQPLRVSVPDGLGGKSYRFQGEVSAWPQKWDPTGTDIWTEIEASGIIRRLSQGPPPAKSSIYRSITTTPPSGLRAYWPMEDATGSLQFATPISGWYPMSFTGSPEMAAYTDFPASDPVALLNDTVLTGPVFTYANPTATQVRFLCYIPADGILDLTNVCVINQEEEVVGTAVRFEMWYNASTNAFSIGAADASGSFLGIQLDSDFNVRNKRMYVSIELAESGANITRTIRIYDLSDQTTHTVSDTMNTTTLSRVTSVQFGAESAFTVSPEGMSAVAIAHVTLEDTITSIDALGISLNPVGESAGTRIQRICAENAIAFESVGSLTDTPLMGTTEKQNPLTMMQEAELADSGMLYESMTVLGMGYRTRVSLCSQDPALTLDYSAFNLSEVPTPVEDDRYIQNQVTVTVGEQSTSYSLTSGSLSVQPPPAGVGVYGSDLTLNLQSASEAASHAAWHVRLGTVDEPRYPEISVNLAHSTFTSNPVLRQAVLGIRQGDRIIVQNLPFWLPPGNIDQLVLGFKETITRFEHRITFTCAPASPYTLGLLDQESARVDTDGSALMADVTSSATELLVKPSTTDETLWTTDSTNFPFNIKVGGEIMTVTNITSYQYDAFGRTSSNSWGNADSGQAWTVVGGAGATDFSVGSGYGSHLLGSVDVSRRTSLDYTYPDVDVTVAVTTSATATGDSLFGGPVTRYTDSSNLYHARVEFTTANAINLDLRRRAGVTEVSLGTYATGLTHVAGTFVYVRLQAVGSRIRAKCWALTDTEPSWQITAADSALPTSLFVGTRSITGPANTNVNPSVRFDSFSVNNPQRFTVTRSVNGVVKAQVADEDLRLASPTIISL